jgi:hypothetical protein
MKAGNFNINEYLDKLYEEAGEEVANSKTPMMAGGEGLTNADGIVIPDTNQKSYNWLKKEYQAGQTEVKVEINMGGAKFEPGYDLQTDLKSVKDFKPGIFGEVKTSDTPGTKEGEDKKAPLDVKQSKPGFQKGEGDETKKETPKTNAPKVDIKDKDEDKKEVKKDNEKPEVKKIDLKTKKTPEKTEKDTDDKKEDKKEEDKKEDKSVNDKKK